jgi:HlyD family secretion protein
METSVKKKLAVTFIVSLAVLTISMQMFPAVRHAGRRTDSAPQSPGLIDLIAGPGRIEPISEDIQLGSELSGKLRSVNVAEGDSVHKGQVLAVLENDDYRADLASAAAQVEAKEATLRKVMNGAREQERAEALAAVHEAQAVMSNAQAELERRKELYQEGVTSREEFEHYTREYNVAQEQYQEKTSHHSLLNTATREEDVAFAQADLRLAQANEAESQARYEKTFIKSPIDGVVLRRHHRNGESVSNSATTPDPVLTIGDARVLRVRVDIDESDVNKVRVGQKAYVTADAYGKQKIWGHVVQVGELLGPKTVRTDEPTERVDRKFLETLVELDPGAQLPMGLRVDTFILTEGEQTAAVRPAT